MAGKRRGRPVITQERMYANTKVVMHSKECGPCMEWQGATKNGRECGKIMMNGKHIMAHRLSYIFVNGPIPDGHLVLHRCDNPICINPAHLFTGTVYDSIQDAYNRNRANAFEWWTELNKRELEAATNAISINDTFSK